MKHGLFALLGILAASPTFARAEGGSSGVGHGGDAVILSDDTVVLADPFLKRNDAPIEQGGTPFDLHPLIIEELKRAARLLSFYGALPELSEKLILDPHARYFEVESFTDERCLNRADYKVPDGANPAVPVACTQGKKTWVISKLYRRMSIREQAKTVVHERLRGRTIEVALPYAAQITNGLEILLSLFHEQQSGALPRLGPEQVQTLESLRALLVQLHPWSSSPDGFIRGFRIWENGGGLVSRDAEVSPSAYVGTLAKVSVNTQIGGGAYLFDTELPAGLKRGGIQLGAHSRVAHVHWGMLEPRTLRLGERSRIEDTILDLFKTTIRTVGRNDMPDTFFERSDLTKRTEPPAVVLGTDTVILRSNLTLGDLIMHDRAEITDTKIYNSAGANLLMEEESKLAGSNFKLRYGRSLALSAQAQVRNLALQSEFIPRYVCQEVHWAFDGFKDLITELYIESMHAFYQSLIHDGRGDRTLECFSTPLDSVVFAAKSTVDGEGVALCSDGTSEVGKVGKSYLSGGGPFSRRRDPYRKDTNSIHTLEDLKKTCVAQPKTQAKKRR